ncbi:MAG TPA: hypothetical protein PLN93_09565 [Vicinamibacterales bacterium]|nr:hypothetical protein [Vicinamibacterales bacterium]
MYRQLPKRVGDWMERLSSEGIHGADLVFACIGPAMEVYSRYSKVEDAQGREIPLGGDPEAREPHKRGFLAYVWEMVGRAALNQVLGTGKARPTDGAIGLEEDARLTALFLWTLQATASDEDESPRARRRDDEDDKEGEDDEDDAPRKKARKGLTLIFDVVRRFAQPLGIHLDQFEDRIISTEKGIVRLLPVSERAEQLFGREGASAVAGRIEAGTKGGRQLSLDFIFDRDADERRTSRGGRRAASHVRDEDLTGDRGGTTLDRLHVGMLLQSAGRANALRAFLKAEVERSPDFMRLANALSALYPKDSEEKRLLDAMLLAAPR